MNAWEFGQKRQRSEETSESRKEIMYSDGEEDREKEKNIKMKMKKEKKKENIQ
jgi:hypothetical protein